MARNKNDGRGRLGGRRQGTPNKDKPLKIYLQTHSLHYFIPTIEEKDGNGKPTGRMLSLYDLDIMALEPADRVDAELKLLKFHTPQMQSTNMDMTMTDERQDIANRIMRLADGEDIGSEE